MVCLRIPVFAIVAAAGNAENPTLDGYKADKAAKQADAEEAAANEAKMAAVNKVITMLEDLTKQVIAEGEKEAASYNEFACFCKDMTVEKNDLITKGTDDKTSLEATISDLQEKRDAHDQTIQELEALIEEAEEEKRKATKERKTELAVYQKNEADLSGAIEAIEGAIEVLKNAKPSLAQLQSVAKTVRGAAMMADALGIGGAATQRAVALFLQQDPSVPMEDYKFKSGSVIEQLEKLQGDFKAEKNELDAAEVKSVAEYDAFMEEKNHFVATKTDALDDEKKEKDKTTQEIALQTAELTTVSADLLDNQQYLKELAEMCSAHAKTWDQRTKVRADELSALTAAAAVIKSGVSEKTSAATVRFAQAGVQVRLAHNVAKNEQDMEALEAAAEEADGPVSFLQRNLQKPRNLLAVLAHKNAKPSEEDGKQMVISLLKSEGFRLKSTLLTGLASQLQADPFAKIKKLIQDLIEKLLAEAAAEANQKGWCDKAQGEAKQKRSHSSESIAELNAHMAELEATRDKLNEELELLVGEIAELEQKQEEATKLRKEEKSENAVNLMEATAGLEAVEEAIDILDKFYKTAAKETVELKLIQRGPLDDAPDAGFEAGEAYQGAGGESGGILGMLDVIKSDFERTISETEKAEASAEQQYMKFMTESGVSLAEKKMAQEQKTKQRDTAVEELASADEDLTAQTELLKLAVKELIELAPTCIDTGMTYEERVARREEEIAGLKKALCVIENFSEMGPDGAGASC